MMRTLEFADGRLRLIDQTQLPHRRVFVECASAEQVGEAIASMRVRGAPAIGVAGAYGMVLGALEARRAWGGGLTPERLLEHAREVARRLKAARPTAVNLAWAVGGCLTCLEQHLALGVDQAVEGLVRFAADMAEEDVRVNRRIGAHGAMLIPDGANVLTHCNTGALATVDFGTALGAIRTAAEGGKRIHVWVDETRPFLQGARLTAWELQQLGIPMTLIADNMAAHFMARGRVDLVIVGADRIAANGDVANKIGTYALAVLCGAHGIPFYVAAPTSSVDLSLASGSEIPIEERDPREVTHLNGQPIAPEGIVAAHPAFDITPARLVTAIVTESGVCHPPYAHSLPEAVASARRSAPLAEVAG